MASGRTQSAFYSRDWFLGLVLSLVLVAAWWFGRGPLQSLGLAAYDSAVGLSYRSPVAARKLVVVSLGGGRAGTLERSPRARLAELLRRLHADGAEGVALLVPLDQADAHAGIGRLHRALRALDGLAASGVNVGAVRRPLMALDRRLDTDDHLAAAIAHSGPVYLAMRLAGSGHAGTLALPPWVARSSLGAASAPVRPPLLARLLGARRVVSPGTVRLPLAVFGTRAAGIGFLDPGPRAAGTVRRVPLVARYRGRYYASVSLLLAARLLGVGSADIRVLPGRGVRLGSTTVPTTVGMYFRPGFYRPGAHAPFHRYAASQVTSGRVPASAFRNRMVLVDLSPALSRRTWATPVARSVSQGNLTANVAAAIADQDYYRRPGWAPWAEAGAAAAVVLIAAGAAPALPLTALAFTVVVLALGEVGLGYYLMLGARQWVDLSVPALLLVIATAGVAGRRLLRGRHETVQQDAAEAARQLGLTYQAQGQLDLAMDKFRELPVDASALEMMYNLALDYERRGRTDRALSAYNHILEHRDGYRDVRARRRQAIRREQPSSRPRTDGRGAEEGLPKNADGEVLTHLGRYALTRYLGRGAMGAVYLGEDPRIHRVVALKTLALDEEFGREEIDEVRERFFREAEVAGRLSHPSVVTIYDAGEDQQLAYIAMEYLEGTDLRPYTRKGNLLPVNRVMEIVAQVAEGLDYAHKHGVVHRDIKPSNVILDPRTRRAKVGDFGIARIVSSGRTRTGAILGTPPYMSPEQLAGKRVDGRSDLFSLGVLLFELIAGRRPFEGETVSTLMYRITHEQHPDIMDVRGGIPICLRNLIDRALQKDPGARFQTAAQMRTALLRCIRNNYTVTSGAADTGAPF